MKGLAKFTFITAIALMIIVGLGRAGLGMMRRRLST